MTTQRFIVFIGYSKPSYIRAIRRSRVLNTFKIACIYERKPTSEAKASYLDEFDLTIDLTRPNSSALLEAIRAEVAAITCTQERDMGTYIKVLYLCKKITSEQRVLYEAVIDKLRFKEILTAKHPGFVPQVFELNDATVTQAIKKLPLVLKPSGLAGSTLVKIVRQPKELSAYLAVHCKEVDRIAHTFYAKKVRIIAEQYIAGPQYSINAYVDGKGHPILCPIIRVVTPQELGIHDSYSAIQYTTTLPPEDHSSLQDAIEKIVHTFQIKQTSAHFDTVLTPGGWKFFEVGLRIGGNRQELFERSHFFSHIENDINNRLGKVPFIPPARRCACIVQTASQTTGILQKIHYARTITTEKSPLIWEDKMSKLGNRVAPVCDGGGTVSRHFVVGKNESEVIEAARELFYSIRLDVSEDK